MFLNVLPAFFVISFILFVTLCYSILETVALDFIMLLLTLHLVLLRPATECVRFSLSYTAVLRECDFDLASQCTVDLAASIRLCIKVAPGEAKKRRDN